MSRRPRLRFTTRRVLHAASAASATVLVVGLLVPASVSAAKTDRIPTRPPPAPMGGRDGFFDARRPARTTVPSARIVYARARLAKRLGPEGILSIDPLTRTPRLVAKLNGFLTPASSRSPRSIGMNYLKTNLTAFGLTSRDLATLRFDHDYVDVEGGHHLTWVQESGGLVTFDNGLKVNLTSDGRVIDVTGSPVHGLRTSSAQTSISVATALSAARRGGGARVRTGEAQDRATLVLFHTARGTRRAWKTTTFISPEQIDLSIVDAQTGAVLWRTNQVKGADGTGEAWEYYPSDDVPNGGGVQQAGVTFDVTNGTKLAGNFAHVYSDVNDDDRAQAKDEIAASDAGALEWLFDFVPFTPSTQQNCSTFARCSWDRKTRLSWKTNRKQNAVQLFYYLTKYHDHLEATPIGFTEAAGNFQLTNASGQGKANDPVQGQILDGANTNQGLPDAFHYNNANMYTPPDGERPIMQMYLFHRDPSVPGFPSGNAGDDASIVYHEYTHGLTNRLVSYPNGVSALNTRQSGAMGEAWSDWYALDFLVQQGYQVDQPGPGDLLMSPYITGGAGIRTQGADCTVGAAASACPAPRPATGSGGYTYGDFGRIEGRPEVHSDGEIWLQTLWELRGALGPVETRCLVTRALELSPADPSFLDMRNAILQADVATCDGTNDSTQIWSLFAGRGMGFFASALDGNDVTPTPDTDGPPSCPTNCSRVVGTIRNSVTGRPIANALVGFGGHLSGARTTSSFPGTDLLDRTDAHGQFRIDNVPNHRYADLVVTKPAHEPVLVHGFLVNGTEHLLRTLNRDWAAIEGGAHVLAVTPPNYGVFGCGPRGAFDLSLTVGWGSDAPKSQFGSHVTGPRTVVIRLPRAVDIRSFGVDPGPACGDPLSAAVRSFRIQTRTLHGPWVTALARLKVLPAGRLNRLLPQRGKKNVIAVRLTMLSNRGNPYFMDMSELSVRGS